MRGFVTSDFPDYTTYETHRRALNRAQGVSDQLLTVYDDMTCLTRRHPGMYSEIQQLMHDATQIGYETGIGMEHRAKDYDITPETLSNRTKCKFCTNSYYVYGCEHNCKRINAGLPCELEVKEFLE